MSVWKKSIGLLTCFVMVLSLFLTACTSDDDAKNTTKDTTDGKKTEDKATKDSDSDGNFNATGYPIVNEKMTFKIMIPGPEINPNDMENWQELEELTNIHIEWDLPSYNQMEEKKNLMFASGDYVDALGGWILSSTDIVKYGPMGVLLPLEDMIENNTINIKKSLEDYPEAKSILTLPDGHIYTLPIIAKQPPTRATTGINKTWLDKIGKDVPTTTDELYEVLKLFKTSDPNGNGEADEIPMTFVYNGQGNDDNYGMFGWFGYIDMKDHMVQVDEKVLWTPAQEEWKDAIKYFRKLYTEGLIDQEIFTNDDSYNSKLRSNPSIVGVFSNWNVQFGDTDIDDEYVFLPPLQSPNGMKPAWPDGDPWVFRAQTALTMAANEDGKDARALMRWIDSYYNTMTPDGPSEFYRGPEGMGWEKTADGKIKGLEEKVLNENVPDWKYKWGGLPGWCWYEPIEYAEMWDRNEGDILKRTKSGEAYSDYQGQQLPRLWLTEEQSSEASAYRTDLEKLTEEVVGNWISGKGDIDAEYDQYISDCEKMGLNELLAIYQEALDAYYRSK